MKDLLLQLAALQKELVTVGTMKKPAIAEKMLIAQIELNKTFASVIINQQKAIKVLQESVNTPIDYDQVQAMAKEMLGSATAPQVPALEGDK